MKHFIISAISFMIMMQNFEVISNKFYVRRICTREKCAQKWVTNLYNINLQSLLTSSHRLKHLKGSRHHKFFTRICFHPFYNQLEKTK